MRIILVLDDEMDLEDLDKQIEESEIKIVHSSHTNDHPKKSPHTIRTMVNNTLTSIYNIKL